MRTLVVGAGAIGQYAAASLKLAGHDAVLWARPQVALTLGTGYALHVGGRERRVLVPLATARDQAVLSDPFDVAIIAVKAYSTRGAIDAIRAIPACDSAVVLTVQNGLGNEEQCETVFGTDRVVAGALTTAVERVSDGVDATRRGGLTIAPLGPSAHNWLIAGLGITPIKLGVTSDWRALKFSKLLLNILGNAVCAILDWEAAKVYADRSAFSIERRCLLEAIATMDAERLTAIDLIDVPVTLLVGAARKLPESLLRVVLRGQVSRGRGGKLPSLLVAARAKQPQTEVDALNGAVAERAARSGVPAPANATITRVLSSILSGSIDWNDFRGKPAALAAEIEAASAIG